MTSDSFNHATEPSALPGPPSSLIAHDLGKKMVLLAPDTVLVKNCSGTFVPCRALLD